MTRPAALLLALMLLASPNGGKAQALAEFTLEIAGGQLKSGPQVVRVRKDDRVRLIWRSDQEVELHLHGYDREIAVPSGRETLLEFAATATGRFPLTLHGHGGHDHATLLYLEVHPR